MFRSFTADVLVSYAGERWDFIIETNQEIAAYRIRTRGIVDCAPKHAHQEAILRYEGAAPVDSEEEDSPYDWVRQGMVSRHGKPMRVSVGQMTKTIFASSEGKRSGTPTTIFIG